MDLSSFIEFLGSLRSDIYIPSTIILGAFSIFLVLRQNETISKSAPGILITLGILFTFIGITIALFNFDPQNITRTIPELLEGLKLAFISSIVGLTLSIIYRLIMIILVKPIKSRTGKRSSNELTEKDFYEQIENINKSIQEGNKNIKEALVGEGDASLSTQMGKLRNDFRDFAEKVAKIGSEELIKALEEVIQDFNKNLTEQFGDNFKELNEAVKKLVTWQEEYKNQVERLTEIFHTVQTGIQQANESINNIKESTEQIPQHTAQIPEHMEHLQTAFNATEQRMKELYDGLQGLATIKENAERAIPDIQGHLDNILGEMQAGAERQRESINQNLASVEQFQQNVSNQIKEHSTQMTDAIENSTKQQHQAMEENLQSIQRQQQQVNDQITESIQNVNNQMKDHLAQMTHSMENSAERQRESINKNLASVERLQQNVSDQIKDHSTQMTNAIENSAKRQSESINQNLTSVEQLQQNVNDQIKDHLTQMTSAIENSAKRQRQAIEEQQQQVNDHITTSIQNVNNQMKDHLAQMTNAIENSAKRQSESINQNLTSVEQLQQNVNDQIKDHLTQMTSAIENSAEKQRQAIEEQQQQVNDQITESIQNVNNQMKDNIAQMTQAIENSTGRQRQAIEEQQQQVNEHIKASIQNVDTDMQAYMQNINKQIENALETMGNNLTPIARQLVRDYEEHQRVIQAQLEQLQRQIKNQ